MTTYRKQANQLMKKAVDHFDTCFFTTKDVIREIDHIVDREKIELITTPTISCPSIQKIEGGWKLTDFADRVRKRLLRLVDKDILSKEMFEGTYVFKRIDK